MSFLNPLLAVGAAALTVPLIIHLLNRSRFRTVQWAAMHLLESVISTNRRRFRIDQLLLLLIRCAIPALLAFLMARPVLTGSGTPAGSAPASLVILLDNSYSMEVADPAGTRFDAAVETACGLVEASPAGSEFVVLLTGGQPTPLFEQPISDSRTVVRRLRQLQAGFGASAVSDSLDRAISVVAGMSHARREIVILSDFQPADWQTFRDESGAAVRERLQQQSIPVELSLLPIVSGKNANAALVQTPNLVVERLELPPHAIAVGQEIAVRAQVRNYGGEELASVRVVLNLDGEELSVVQTSLQPDGVTQVLFPCTVQTPGSHVLNVEVVHADALAADNHCSAAILVQDDLPVLLVDGDPSTGPLQSETDYLSVALTPFTFGRLQLSDLITTRTITTDALSADSIADSRVIVLANVARLSDVQLAALTEYVEGGGTLLVTAGNRLDLNWYRDQFFAAGNGLLPAAFQSLRGLDPAASGDSDEGVPTARILAQRFEHPSLILFNDPSGGDLSAAEIRRWYQVRWDTPAESSEAVDGEESDNVRQDRESTEESATVAPVTVIARLDSGDPLILERRVGDGVVLQMATACDAEWSDLPQRPVFVPLMQQLITGMATGVQPPRNIAAGEPAVVVVPEFQVSASAAVTGEAAAATEAVETSLNLTSTVLTPTGAREAVPVVREGRLLLSRYQQTLRPGVYTMTLPDGSSAHVVSATSVSESALRLMDEPECEQLADELQATLVSSEQEWLARDQLRRYGREIWQYLLIGLLGLLLLEMILQQRFAGVRG